MGNEQPSNIQEQMYDQCGKMDYATNMDEYLSYAARKPKNRSNAHRT